MMTRLGLFLVLVLAAASHGQSSSAPTPQGGPGFKKPTQKPMKPVPQGPVTGSEAVAAFARLEKAVASVLKVRMRGTPVITGGAKPVSREDVVAAMGRIFDSVRGEFKYTPRPMRFEPSKLAVKRSRAVAESLITWGFVSRVAPLVSGPKDSLTVSEFGDALGLFTARLAELTHTSSMKWSPHLMPPN